MSNVLQTATRATTIVKLSSPVLWFDRMISEVEIEEPSGGLFLDLGEPLVPLYAKDGARTMVEVAETINGYIDACIKIESPRAFLRLVSLRDGQEIKDRLLRFFLASLEPTSS